MRLVVKKEDLLVYEIEEARECEEVKRKYRMRATGSGIYLSDNGDSVLVRFKDRFYFIRVGCGM